jgi:anti-anti-sigma factor
VIHVLENSAAMVAEVYLVADELDADGVEYLRERTLTAFGQTNGKVVIDCAAIRRIEPGGLCFLLEMTRIGQVRGVEVVLEDPSDAVLEVLRLSGLADSVHIADHDGADAVVVPPLPDVVGPPIHGFPVAHRS